jgi:hypothetical protein
MPRYLVERTFPNGLAIPVTDAGAQACQGVVATNAEDGVTWIQSYVTPDRKRCACWTRTSTAEAQRVASEAWPSHETRGL